MLTELLPSRPADDVAMAREGALELWRHLVPEGGSAKRMPLELAGRYQVGDGNEFPCEATEISALGVCVKGPKIGRVGDRCLVNINSVGILEGVVVAAQQQNFVVGVIAPPRRVRRLAERLSWHLRRNNEEVPERRASERVELTAADGKLETETGQSYSARIFDVSDGGAALHLGNSALYFWVDQPVAFDGRPAKVLRYFPGGIVIKFD